MVYVEDLLYVQNGLGVYWTRTRFTWASVAHGIGAFVYIVIFIVVKLHDEDAWDGYPLVAITQTISCSNVFVPIAR